MSNKRIDRVFWAMVDFSDSQNYLLTVRKKSKYLVFFFFLEKFKKCLCTKLMYPQFRHKSYFFATIFFYFYFFFKLEARRTHVLPRTTKTNIKSCNEKEIIHFVPKIESAGQRNKIADSRRE